MSHLIFIDLNFKADTDFSCWKTFGSSPEPTEAEKYLAKGFWVLRGWDARPIDGVHPPSRRKCLRELGGGKKRRGRSGFVGA